MARWVGSQPAAATASDSHSHGHLATQRLTRLPLEARLGGALWLVLGLSKVAAPETFLEYIKGVVALAPAAASVLGWSLIGSELVLGISLVLVPRRRHTALRLLSGLSLVVATSVLLYVMLQRVPQECGCFGSLATASRASRLVVAGALVFLSAGAVRALLGARAIPTTLPASAKE